MLHAVVNNSLHGIARTWSQSSNIIMWCQHMFIAIAADPLCLILIIEAIRSFGRKGEIYYQLSINLSGLGSIERQLFAVTIYTSLLGRRRINLRSWPWNYRPMATMASQYGRIKQSNDINLTVVGSRHQRSSRVVMGAMLALSPKPWTSNRLGPDLCFIL